MQKVNNKKLFKLAADYICFHNSGLSYDEYMKMHEIEDDSDLHCLYLNRNSKKKIYNTMKALQIMWGIQNKKINI